MGIIGGILAFIGLIIVLWFFYWLYFHELNKSKKNVQINRRRPSDKYMENVGLKCPDYWVYTGDDQEGNYMCKNTFNIDVKTPKDNYQCFDPNTNIKTFSIIKKWENKSKEERKDLASTRCKWIQNCGAAEIPTSKAVWLGVDQYCSG